MEPTTLPNGKDVYHLDASSLKNSSCLLRMFLQNVRGIRGDANNISLTFGSAVHKWAEFYLKYKKQENGTIKAYAEAQKWFRTNIEKVTNIPKQKEYLNDILYFTRVCQTFEQAYEHDRYLKEMQIQEAPPIGPLVELKFCIPVAEGERFVVMLSGTIDGIYRLPDTGVYILNDIKTTSASDLEGYLKGYELSSQLHTYLYAVRYMAQQKKDTIFSAMQKFGVGFRITAVNLKGKTQDPKVQCSSIIYQDDNKLNEFQIGLDQYVNQFCGMLKAYYDSGKDPTWRPYKEGLVNGSCQAAWGSGCTYAAACQQTRDEMFWEWLKTFGDNKPYNPLEFR